MEWLRRHKQATATPATPTAGSPPPDDHPATALGVDAEPPADPGRVCFDFQLSD